MVKENYDFELSNDLILKSKTNKKQIVLTNTSYPINDYLTRIKLRYNKKYNKVPAYTIDRSGTLFFHFNPENISNFFENEFLNKTAIPISLENVGWLDYIEDKNIYVDWRGIEYKGNVIKKNWRNKKYWAEYTDEQINTLLELIDYLCIQHSISKNFVGNNVFMDDADKFNGILNRSNFNKNYHDLTPAFDFEKLTKEINK
jgi:hypothetical protein